MRVLLALATCCFLALLPQSATASQGCDDVNAGGVDNSMSVDATGAVVQSGYPAVTTPFTAGDVLHISYSGSAGAAGRVNVIYTGVPTNTVVKAMFQDNTGSPISGTVDYTILGTAPIYRVVAIMLSSSDIGSSISFTLTCSPAGPAPASTTTIVTSSLNPSTSGDSITFTATVTGSSPTGTITFKDGPTTLGTGTLSGGTATYATSGLSVGSHTITADYGGDSGNAASTSSSLTQVVNVAPASTTTTVTSSLNPSTSGDSITFTATVTGSSPTGTITFKDGPTTLGTGTLSGGTATYATSGLSAGSHTITADYGGDSGNAASTSSNLTQVVNAILVPTTTTVLSSLNPSVSGRSITFTATVTGSSPTGTVTFKDGGTSIGTGTITSGRASYVTSSLGVGPHTITAEYGGDGAHAPSASFSLTQVVKAAPVATTTTIASSLNPSTYGVSVTFTATVTGSSPTGTVTFKDGVTTLGTGTLVAGKARYSTSALSVASHAVMAVYGGDSANTASTSSAMTQVVKAQVRFVFSPASGAALKPAMAGEAYDQTVKATGGTGKLTYALSSGSLPAGVTLHSSSGALSGTLPANAAVKTYHLRVKVTDINGATGTASYSIAIKPRVTTAPDKDVVVRPGSAPLNVDLTKGATGGPFTNALVLNVQPPGAGTASIVRGEFAEAAGTPSLGWYLKFIPNPLFNGSASVSFQLKGALGLSNPGFIHYHLAVDPEAVKTRIETEVKDFVRTRQELIANTITVPGLVERREMAEAANPVSARMMPSEEGLTVNLATSLAQLEAARDGGGGHAASLAGAPFNIWLDGTFLAFDAQPGQDRTDHAWGSFTMVNMGMDYLLTDKMLLGLSLHFDQMRDSVDPDLELTGKGWLAGPYASLELAPDLFWNASLLYGGSANQIDTTFWNGSFDTGRLLVDSSLSGKIDLQSDIVFTPKLRAVYVSEKVDDYAVRNGEGTAIALPGFDLQQFRLSLGAEMARSFTLESGSTMTPKLGLTGGIASLDGDGAFATVTAGLSFLSTEQWMLDGGVMMNLSPEGTPSIGARAQASRSF